MEKEKPQLSDAVAQPEPTALTKTVPVIAEIARLRERYIDLSKALRETIANLLAESYALSALATHDSGVAKAAVEEIRRLGGKINSRNGVEHCAVLIAFHEELPAKRTKYVNALRGGRQLGISFDEFREVVLRGADGKDGIKQLAGVVKKPTSAPTPARESQQQLLPPLARHPQRGSVPHNESASGKSAEARLTFGRRAREKVAELSPERNTKIRCILKFKGTDRWRVVGVRGLVRVRRRRHYQSARRD
jgi:hypothetical protein